MYTLLSSMSIGYNDILNKKEKKNLTHSAVSVSSLLGWNRKAALEVLQASVLPEN